MRPLPTCYHNSSRSPYKACHDPYTPCTSPGLPSAPMLKQHPEGFVPLLVVSPGPWKL